MTDPAKNNNHLWQEAQRAAQVRGLVARTSWHDSSTGIITGLFAKVGKKTVVGKVRIQGGRLIECTGVMREALAP